MESRFHICGYPIRVRKTWQELHHVITFYDGSVNGEVKIERCPQCGGVLAEDNLTLYLDSLHTLMMWQHMWPSIRHQIEMLVMERTKDNPDFYAYHAEQAIVAFDNALVRVGDLITYLTTSSKKTSN